MQPRAVPAEKTSATIHGPREKHLPPAVARSASAPPAVSSASMVAANEFSLLPSSGVKTSTASSATKKYKKTSQEFFSSVSGRIFILQRQPQKGDEAGTKKNSRCGAQFRVLRNPVKTGWHHEQQKRAVEPAPKAGRCGRQSEMQQRGDECADINAGAALAARQRFAARRPGVRKILAADVTEKLVEKIQHGFYFRPSSCTAGSGMGTLVILGRLRSTCTRKSAQSSGLSEDLFFAASQAEEMAHVRPSWESDGWANSKLHFSAAPETAA